MNIDQLYFRYLSYAKKLEEPDYSVHIEDLSENQVRVLTKEEFSDRLITGSEFNERWGKNPELKPGDWVICGYLESHWEKYPNNYSDDSKIKPERVDRVAEPWVYLQSGAYLHLDHVRPATDHEVTDWIQYLEKNEDSN